MQAPEGFAEFVSARSHRLLHAAWLLTGDTGRAEDLLQTVLAKAWRHWRRIEAGDAEAYVRRMLFTTYATWWRRKWRAEQPTGALPERAHAGDLAGEAADRDAVQRALARVSRQQRAIVVLRFLDDLSVAETAEMLGCSQATVKTQTVRALAAMRADPQLQHLRAEEITA
ncbi:SigE family RNA polymerase sigma factor [Actinoplanes sp. NBRC 101535]|uniref:SigE family RNA polymerase sigma factor n=1 Tax=Actinoplanes sp. NBRC 101535 TaxID=3032196 RepID=UPI0024A297E3|nr:SigE family RNA polymerase sigma factor [Actinoplanes sp. NBRC 101535]GLY05030.1 DNA-directed RNA polymerase sigma-70 factor [Actinoplanes sp. NBRC 101535]